MYVKINEGGRNNPWHPQSFSHGKKKRKRCEDVTDKSFKCLENGNLSPALKGGVPTASTI